MKNFIVAFIVSAVLLSCTTSQSKKLDVVVQINQDILHSPSAAGGNGINYYVCNDGDDINDGLSPETPWKTFDKGMSVFNTLNAGDAVLFCTGGTFNVLSRKTIFNRNCDAYSPCIISSYQNSVEVKGKPILYNPNGDVLRFTDSGASDRDGGYLVEDISFRGAGVGTAMHFSNDVDDVEIKNVEIDNFAYGVNIGGSNAPKEGSDSNALNERITLSDSLVRNNTKKGYKSTCSESCELIDNVFQNNNNDPLDEIAIAESDTTITIAAEPIVKSSAWPEGFKGMLYVCDTGLDENDGVSPDSAYKTFDYAMSYFNKLPAGGGIAFCRGGTFTVESSATIFNQSCNAGNKCVITDYGNDINKDRPIFESPNGGVFKFSDSGTPDQDGGYYVSNLILKGSGLETGISFSNDVDDVVVENVVIDNFKRGFSVGNSKEPSEKSDGKMDRIIFKRSTLINSHGNGYLGGCDGCQILNSYFENNGVLVNFHHNIYIGFGNKIRPFKNMKIEGNTLYKSNSVDGECRGVSLVVHGRIDGINIEGNTIKEDLGEASMGCWGISLDPGYGDDEYFKNVIIKDNFLLNVGGNGIGCASCENVLIEGNIIRMQSAQKMNGIRVPIKKDDLTKTTNVEIRNNTIELEYSGEKPNMNTGVYIAESDGNYSISGNRVKTLNKFGLNECIYDRNIISGLLSNVSQSNNLCVSYY